MLRSDTVQFLMKSGIYRYCTPSKERISVRLFSQIHLARIRMCLQSDGTRDSDWTTFYLGIALPAALGLALVVGFWKFFLRSPEIVNIECSRVELCPIKTTCIMISDHTFTERGGSLRITSSICSYRSHQVYIHLVMYLRM